MGYPTWPDILFVRSFSWVAAIKAPEVIKNPKPSPQLVVLNTCLWISPSCQVSPMPRLRCVAPTWWVPNRSCSAEPEGRRRCWVPGGKKAASLGHSKGKAQIYCTLPAAPLGLLWDPRGQAPSGQGCAAGRTGLGGSSCGKSGLSTLHINAPCALIAMGPLPQSH